MLHECIFQLLPLPMHPLPLDALATWTVRTMQLVKTDCASIPALYEILVPHLPIAKLSITTLYVLVQMGTLETLEQIVDYVSKNSYR